MRVTPPAATMVAIALAGAGCVIVGCGGGASSTTISSGTPITKAQAVVSTTDPSGPPVTKAQAVAYAHAVNLQAADLPDLRVSAPERPGKIAPDEGAFARCVGESDPRREIAKFKSATFKYPAGFGQVQSSVTVQPIQALALSNFRASLQPRLVTCLKSLLPVALARKAERRLHYGAVKVARVSGLPVPGATGVAIGTSIIVPRLPNPVPVYIDEFGFIVGPAEITLMTEGVPRPIPPEVEGRLLSLLYSRAREHKL
jgi:hypothetical protein